MDIKDQFDAVSEKYDANRRQFIPCFDDFYQIPLTVMDFPGDNPRILDVGSGTGLFSAFLLEKYPNANLTLIDLSDQMLAIAKERFQNHQNVSYLVADYTKYEFEDQFDMIISALSIHHLTAADKKALYRKCWNLLEPDGIFINADQALSPSPITEVLFGQIWREKVENSGLDSDEIAKAYERVKLDNPSTMEEQLEWLREAGFQHVDCLYKYYHFCTFYGKK